MDVLQLIRHLWAHTAWADAALFDALITSEDTTPAWREYAHLLGAESVWLARLEQRPSPVAVWPTLSHAEADALRQDLAKRYDAYLDSLEPDSLDRVLAYRTSNGQDFETKIGDILLHVALHGQYHRGKINLLLRQAALEPAPVDYISFVRGVPAAVTPVRTP